MQTSLFSNLKRKDDIDIQYTPIKPDKKLTGASISRGSVMYPEVWRFFPFSSASAILSSNQFSLDKNSYKSQAHIINMSKYNNTDKSMNPLQMDSNQKLNLSRQNIIF